MGDLRVSCLKGRPFRILRSLIHDAGEARGAGLGFVQRKLVTEKVELYAFRASKSVRFRF